MRKGSNPSLLPRLAGGPSHRLDRDIEAVRRFVPVADVFEDGDAVRIEIDLPGVRPEDVGIDTAPGSLTVRGTRPSPGLGTQAVRAERTYGAFTRTFALPSDAIASAAVAVMADGVLSLRIPKRAL